MTVVNRQKTEQLCIWSALDALNYSQNEEKKENNQVSKHNACFFVLFKKRFFSLILSLSLSLEYMQMKWTFKIECLNQILKALHWCCAVCVSVCACLCMENYQKQSYSNHLNQWSCCHVRIRFLKWIFQTQWNNEHAIEWLNVYDRTDNDDDNNVGSNSITAIQNKYAKTSNTDNNNK